MSRIIGDSACHAGRTEPLLQACETRLPLRQIVRFRTQWMFDQLSERLQDVFANIRGGRQLTEDNMEDALREVRRALLEADVSLRVIKAFISRVKDRAVGEGVIKSVEPGQQLIKIVHDDLVILLGGESKGINLDGN